MSISYINLPKICDIRGNLSFFENDNHIPFKIKRTYWIYDVPGGEARGGHAYRETEEFIVALSGSFDVILDSGNGEKVRYHLNRSYKGLYVPKMVWREMDNFSTNSLALITASTPYNQADYIRDYEQFTKEVSK
jgi:oxalate decarboxylase/phosphoglucose isomerase-like protein (cupin superfamily)